MIIVTLRTSKSCIKDAMKQCVVVQVFYKCIRPLLLSLQHLKTKTQVSSATWKLELYVIINLGFGPLPIG